jgi:hypothetical protein
MDDWSNFWSISFLIIWLGSFLVVSVDSAYRKISPFFWRVAALFGGPFTMLAYCLIREKQGK